jgi:parallel beta-helix repeat protein
MPTVRHAALVLGLSVAIALSACGGSSGGPPPATSLYVRASGNDTNSGGSPATALKTIARAVQLAPSGSRIIVGPGTYNEGVTAASVLAFFADTSGAFTQDPPGAVVIDLSGLQEPGFELSSSKGSLIDGFTIKHAADAGIVLKGSSDSSIIQDCTISLTVGDGIRLQDSSNVLVFNNLVYDNAGTGIGVGAATVGSANAKIVNNTIFGNSTRGITVGDAAPKPASPGTFIRNNIIQNNVGDASIEVFTGSDVGYDEDFDLVTPATFLPVSPDLSGKHDFRDVDAQFVGPTRGDFHLSSSSPAIDEGDTSDLVHKTMTVDSNGQPISISVFLKGRTTTGGTVCDLKAPDLGFHYAVIGRCTVGGA